MPIRVMKAPTPRPRRELFRIHAACTYLGNTVTEDTLRAWVFRRQIEAVHIGRAVCIPKDALDELIEKGTVPARKKKAAR